MPVLKYSQDQRKHFIHRNVPGVRAIGTWQLTDDGLSLLRRNGIGVNDKFSEAIFRDLQAREWVFTGGGGLQPGQYEPSPSEQIYSPSSTGAPIEDGASLRPPPEGLTPVPLLMLPDEPPPRTPKTEPLGTPTASYFGVVRTEQGEIRPSILALARRTKRGKSWQYFNPDDAAVQLPPIGRVAWPNDHPPAVEHGLYFFRVAGKALGRLDHFLASDIQPAVEVVPIDARAERTLIRDLVSSGVELTVRPSRGLYFRLSRNRWRRPSRS